MARVKAAMIGVGNWACVLTEAAALSDKIEIVSCVGRSPERLAAFAKEYDLPARSIEDVLADKEIEGLVLALPNELHYEFARRGAEAGKHIYIEKPIANTMPDALATAALEKMHGVHVVVGHCARLLTGVRAIKAAMDAGKLGKVSQLEANFSNDRGLWLTAKDWRFYQESAPGGSLSQLGVHQFDTMRYLGGDIAAVSASAARHSPVGAEVEDQWIVAVHFADGKLGVMLSNWASPGTYSIRATGSDALMFYDINQTFWSKPSRIHENATLYLQGRDEGPHEREMLPVPPGNMFRDELEIFADAVAGGKDCELSAENGCQALAAVYAAIVSAREHSRVVQVSEVIDQAKAELAGRGTRRAAGG